MHTDARTLPDSTLIEGDLCIIGAGAAGISLALQWIDTPYRVLLVEGGGFDYDFAMQDLYRGEIVGLPYFPLEAARLHFFGGTTGHWAGFCSTFDPLDFEARDWVPHSGWPIGWADLEPYYARAHPLLDLGPYPYDAAWWETQDPEKVRLPLDPQVAWTKMWQFSPPTRFGTKYRAAIEQARNVHLLTYANVCEIGANEAVTTVDGLRVRTPDGKEHRVRARHYVLACCAIQTARLLLASNRQMAPGLGNAHDQVGRYFMEHLEMPSAQMVLVQPEPMKLYLWEMGLTQARGELALTQAAQQTHGLLNGTASLWPGTLDEDTKSTFQLLTPEMLREMMMARAQSWAERGGNLPPLTPEREFHLNIRQEQAPNPNSRVTLSPETDALGMPRVRLDWQLTELDQRSIRVFYEVLGRELGRTGLGRLRIADWLLEGDDTTWPSFLSGGWHHMGTTRMHHNPRQGVVDVHCKVHGLDNLYVAGSAVFTTAGAANPTLTLVALTLRLSDHLRTKMG